MENALPYPTWVSLQLPKQPGVFSEDNVSSSSALNHGLIQQARNSGKHCSAFPLSQICDDIPDDIIPLVVVFSDYYSAQELRLSL